MTEPEEEKRSAAPEDAGIGLTPSQRQAVEHGDGPLLVVAGAGTGKTLVLTRRIAHLIRSKRFRPEEILALTFTEKAAAEMSERVDVLLPYGFAAVNVSTFHAFGDRILREYAIELGLNPDFQVLSEAEQVILFREHLFDFPLKHYRPLSDPTKFIQAMLKVISRAKDEDVSPADYAAYADALRNDPNADPEEAARQAEIAGTYAAYQRLLAEKGKADFGDQVTLTLRLFRERPHVLDEVRKRYKTVLVDEFQDTNHAQFEMVKLLGGPEANITVVGDDDQSIYKFRGAAISNILGFRKTYPQARLVVLTDNFRSSQEILDAAYRLIQHNNPDRLEVQERIDKRLVSNRPGGFPVEHIHADSLTSESDRVAALIQEMLESGKAVPNDIAILVRSNSDADPFLRALNLKNIPWRFSGNRGLYGRSEVRLLISFLRAISDSGDSLNLFAFASSPVYQMPMEDILLCANAARRSNRPLMDVFRDAASEDPAKGGRTESDSRRIRDALDGLTDEGRVTVRKLTADIRAYAELSRDHATGVVLYQFLMQSGFLKRLSQSADPEDGVRIQNIARFFDVVGSFGRMAEEDRVFHFVRHLEMLMEAGDDPGTAEADPDLEAVSVLTVHRAKGLEWPVVFMVSLIHQKFPHTRRAEAIELPAPLVRDELPKGDYHMQEERRLFYVAMTRARDRLFFTGAADYGGARIRKTSPFVLEALDRPHVDQVNFRSGAEERIRRFAPVETSFTELYAPLPDDRVLQLSHFQVDDYLTCPLKYKYVHILRVPILEHHTVVYGKSLHKAVELYHERKTSRVPVSLDDLLRAFESEWKSTGFLSAAHEEQRFEAGRNALRRFFESEEASGVVPILVEEKFSFMIGFNRVEGRWDRVDEREGRVVIVDFKSSEVYQQEAADKRAAESLQLAIYAMAFQKAHGRPVESTELRFLESGLVGRAPVTPKRMEKTEAAVLEAAAGIRGRDYTPKPSYQICRFCAYSEVCPSAAAR
ncbi:MAG: ATP-dependent DNA helicase [bacterium]|nr:ATP-dependent DNA helicase [bacterium]